MREIRKTTCYKCKKVFVPKEEGSCYCPDCIAEGRKEDAATLDRMYEHPNAMLDLTSAILGRATEDYKRDVKKWREAYTSERKTKLFHTIINWCRWFKSDHFGILSMGLLDAAKVQKMVNKEIYEKKKESE